MNEPARRKVYLVLASQWTYNDEYFEGEEMPVLAFKDRAKAEAYAARREEIEGPQVAGRTGGAGSLSYIVVESEVEG